ncbi:hypothetical protein EJ05DRAFT_485348 [Pseudovirgaria hyperparasitica]|uniref:Sulfhydryl oxidase n=1 Tax=Pseudovirgaria hyperparasitica TaxID=470096 RepID=A0A6A6WB92_9PEZI|nr:uncharacterized protein EJ05DRAFT_485348 [Pseudovirgaria hyperparasitica]KAF2759314.1 hypothetical protein EJ05DRAFT_485348 [Pseudovirgaria hyperparasitica]
MDVKSPSRRFKVLIILAATVLSILYLAYPRAQIDPVNTSKNQPLKTAEGKGKAEEVRFENAIAPKLGNETVKAELGRAAWRVLHTTFARFPDEPTADESQALKDYIHLFQRLYPCGECAQHFHELLKKFPPQVSSRTSAATWGCHVHNEVNRKLGKDIFDCANIGDFYDCGCADDEAGDKTSKDP